MWNEKSSVGSTAAAGKYRPIAELGQGGMATVFLAVARGPSGFSKLLVIKCIRDHLAEDPGALRSLLNEARLAARLNHPNIVQTIEVSEHDRRPTLVMEYLEGQPLSSILQRVGEALPLQLHLQILAEVAAGLDYAHELADYDGTPLGLVHRDVSPHNVMISFDGQIKVLDFGVAKAAMSAGETETGVVKGKLKYMAPEQMSGEKVDRRADVFSLGVMLWRAAAGAPLWKGQGDVAIMTSVLNDRIPPPSSVNPDVDRELERICVRALSFRREDRYATCAELERELEQVISSLGARPLKRDIGKFVSSHFDDVRQKTKVIIDEQLRLLVEQDSLNPVPLVSMAQTGSNPTLPTFAERRGTGSQTATTAAAAVPSSPTRKGRWLLGAAGLVIAGLGFGLRAATHSSAAPAASPLASSATGSGAASASPPATVRIRVEATPAQAAFFVDEDLVHGNPVDRTFPKDGRTHRFRAEAKGYVSRTVDLPADSDVTFTLSLDRASSAEQPRPPAGRPLAGRARESVAAAAQSPSPPAPTEKKNNCAVPTYIDDQGIRRVRAECL